ncbi:hypothetical protein IM774_00020 [Erysipelotrichaceae bacterium RD49]|nr:hypothetical protein [Erysipelotrichaceae bacterium RD49]
MKSFKNPFRFTSLLRPMIYLFLFSLIYGFGTLKLMDLPSPYNDISRCLLLSVFGLGLYFVSTLIWGKKRQTLTPKRAGEVWSLCLLLAVVTTWVISPLSLQGGNLGLLLLGAVLGTVCLLFALPTLILFFRAIYNGIDSLSDQIKFVRLAWRGKFWYILDLWLMLFVLMYAWDNFMGGPLFSAGTFDAPSIFTTLMYLKEPTIYFEMILLFSQSAPGTWELTMLGILEAVLMVFLECNIIAWIGQAGQQMWNEYHYNKPIEKNSPSLPRQKH